MSGSVWKTGSSTKDLHGDHSDQKRILKKYGNVIILRLKEIFNYIIHAPSQLP